MAYQITLFLTIMNVLRGHLHIAALQGFEMQFFNTVVLQFTIFELTVHRTVPPQ